MTTPENLADSLLIELDTLSQPRTLLVHSNPTGRRQMPLIPDSAKKTDLVELDQNKLHVTPATSTVTPTIGELEKKFEGRVRSLQSALISYRESLEFTQREVDVLKEENVHLRNKMSEMELEEKRNEFHLKRVDEKLDRQDTSLKRKKLIIEGLRESNNGKEDLRPIIFQLLDDMGARKDITYDTAYRVGPYSNRRPRSVVITFVRIADRDEVYSLRTKLQRSKDFSDIWVNEDLGQVSRRKMNIIRMVARHAQDQGISHKATKFAFHLGHDKYDERNLEDLPENLSLANIKTVKINDDTLAYQSEHSYLSNLYPVKISIGKHNYTSVEQGFHHIRATTLKKPLAASRILLCRSPYDIIVIAREITSTKEWEDCEDDIMYGCILRKFEQNPTLRAQLISTGNMELVEVSPNKKWGAGASLSSNLIKTHKWKGGNKQGQITMTVRDILKKKEEEDRLENGIPDSTAQGLTPQPNTLHHWQSTQPNNRLPHPLLPIKTTDREHNREGKAEKDVMTNNEDTHRKTLHSPLPIPVTAVTTNSGKPLDMSPDTARALHINASAYDSP